MELSLNANPNSTGKIGGNMKVFDIYCTDIKYGIPVVLEPYPHIVLGEGPSGPLGSLLESATQKTIGTSGKIMNVSVIALKDSEGKPNGKYLIVAPRGDENRILVVWRVSSGYRKQRQNHC